MKEDNGGKVRRSTLIVGEKAECYGWKWCFLWKNDKKRKFFRDVCWFFAGNFINLRQTSIICCQWLKILIASKWFSWNRRGRVNGWLSRWARTRRPSQSGVPTRRSPTCRRWRTAELNEIMNGTNIAIGQTGSCVGDDRLLAGSTHTQRVCLEYGYKQPRSRLEYGYSMGRM